jgi:DNA-binding FrmR family transcriptional regulator|tara:strand:+ start:52 stop:354 length:303 start_codon:yes stop_codon:yes gene_type:complete
MVEGDRYCMDILTQTVAILSAILGVEKLLLENHAQHRVEVVIKSGDVKEQRAKFDELIWLLQKASPTATRMFWTPLFFSRSSSNSLGIVLAPFKKHGPDH